jgi:hypothetical protein
MAGKGVLMDWLFAVFVICVDLMMLAGTAMVIWMIVSDI